MQDAFAACKDRPGTQHLLEAPPGFLITLLPMPGEGLEEPAAVRSRMIGQHRGEDFAGLIEAAGGNLQKGLMDPGIVVAR